MKCKYQTQTLGQRQDFPELHSKSLCVFFVGVQNRCQLFRTFNVNQFSWFAEQTLIRNAIGLKWTYVTLPKEAKLNAIEFECDWNSCANAHRQKWHINCSFTSVLALSSHVHRIPTQNEIVHVHCVESRIRNYWCRSSALCTHVHKLIICQVEHFRIRTKLLNERRDAQSILLFVLSGFRFNKF